jgi:hypothetical protein
MYIIALHGTAFSKSSWQTGFQSIEIAHLESNDALEMHFSPMRRHVHISNILYIDTGGFLTSALKVHRKEAPYPAAIA